MKKYSAYMQDAGVSSYKAFDLWYADLREEYSRLNDEVFNLCYDQACRGCPAGYDGVESHMQDIVRFAEKIIKASSN